MGIFCDVGCVQYWPGRLSDMLEMINCIKMKSDLRAQRDFHHKWAAQNEMSHAADFALLTCSVQLQRNTLTHMDLQIQEYNNYKLTQIER